MTELVVTAEPARTLRDAPAVMRARKAGAVAAIMRDRKVGAVVLVRDGRAVGLVTDRDLALSVLADGRDPSGRVGDHASSPVIHVAPDVEVDEAAGLMIRHGIRRLVVLDGERLAGI